METSIEMAKESNSAELDVVGDLAWINLETRMVHHSLVHLDEMLCPKKRLDPMRQYQIEWLVLVHFIS